MTVKLRAGQAVSTNSRYMYELLVTGVSCYALSGLLLIIPHEAVIL